MNCGKCLLEVSSDAGYIKCYGCDARYHCKCSISATTWKAKSQADKELWRCEACRKLAKQGTEKKDVDDVTVQVSRSSGESTELVKLILASLKPLFQNNERSNLSVVACLESNLKSHFDAMNKSTEKLILALCSKIDELHHSLKDVKFSQSQLLEDNVQLKKELTIANNKISTLELKSHSIVSQGTAPLQSNFDGRVPAEQRGLTSIKQSQYTNSRVLAQNKSFAQSLLSQQNVINATSGAGAGTIGINGTCSTSATRSGNGVREIPGISVGGSNETGGVNSSDEPWTTVQYKKPRTSSSRPAPKIGAKPAGQDNNSTVAMVRPREPRERTRALFVSRFAPTVTTEDIKRIVESSVTLSRLKVSKIRTRRQDLYASFHVEVLDSDFEKIDTENVWPDGCLMKPFWGRLLPEIVISDVPISGIVPEP